MSDDVKAFFGLGAFGRLLSTDIPALCKEVRELRLALLRYGGHEPACAFEDTWLADDCTCGWSELKQRLEKGAEL